MRPDPFAPAPDPDPEAWRKSAACAGMDPAEANRVFFSQRSGDNYDLAEAQRICEGCPVRVPCLDYAMDRNEGHGVWGGTSGRERQRLQRSWVRAKAMLERAGGAA